ncbi:histone-lysine N-methyltransferase, H3 lysine-79 specific-like [Branchiostoma floridae]|uniref:Histone-lysine N-methyltransferase, H3 lysine-79 specific-like n=2 Tax=Branchiostoma floridae TaxID=7739 RepID=A0A9J7MHC1_BRAFL|nr:histone-lysine N-methyltransferase, H3 lysine-79 specific-like [Branchiostoma floridae]
MGRPSILSPEEEGALVVYAKYLAEKGFPPTVRVIKALAFEVEKKRAKGRGEEPRFKDSGPGKRWWKGFKGRHPDLSLRSPDQLDKERAAFSTAGVVFEHFERLEQILTDAKAKDKRPHVIYNADETGMDLSAKVSKVIVPKGWKRSPSRRVGGRDHVSALVCISAAGQTVPPMIIYNKAFPGGKYTEGGPANALYAYSDSGFIDDELFERWFKLSFLKHCTSDRPVILILDQHYSHITLRVLEDAIQNDVIILGLPPHTTHFLQPLDVSVFAPLKKKWAMTLEVMQAANTSFHVTKRNFANIFSSVYDNAINPAIIKTSFAKTGIYPFNDEAVDDKWIRMSAAELGESTSTTATPTAASSTTATPTATATSSTTATPTATSTSSTTETPTVTATSSTTATPTATATSSTTETPTVTATSSTTATPTATATSSTTETPTATATSSTTETPTATATSSTTETPTATSSTTATPSAMTPTAASSSQQDRTPASASNTACPTCNAACTVCNPLQSPLIQTLIPPELHDILIPIPPAKKSSRCNLNRRLTGRVLTHSEVMEEMRLKEKEKKEKEEKKERRKEEMKKKREEKEQKELEKRLQKEKKQAESVKKLAEKEERKRKRQELAEARKKQRIEGKENQRPTRPRDVREGSSRSRPVKPPSWYAEYEMGQEEDEEAE